MKQKFFLFFILLVSKTFAQYGGIDLTFNPGASTNLNHYIQGVDYNKLNQKILIFGDFDSFAGVSSKGVSVLNNDGSIFSGFTSSLNFSTGNVFVSKAKWLADGKILIAGVEYLPTNYFLKRLNSDGTIDTSFNISVNGSVDEMFIQADGKIIISGAFSSIGGVPRNGIARITSAGFVDATFYPGAGIPSGQVVSGIGMQSNGKYIVVGNFAQYDIYAAKGIVRLNNDGSFDNTFSIGTGPNNNTVGDVSILKNDKIVVSGTFTNFNGFATTNKVAQLNLDGSVDAAVSLGNFTTSNSNANVKHLILPDDQIILYSSGENFIFPGGIRNQIAKINRLGFLNQDFDPGSSFAHSSFPYLFETILQPSGNLLTVGQFDSYGGIASKNIVRILNKIDNNFASYCSQTIGRVSVLSGATNGRIYTNGNASVCGTAKPFPGVNDIGNLYYYNAHTFTNNSSVSQCVTFNLKTLASNNGLNLSIYNGSFNNTNLAQNYLADNGQAIVLGNSRSCSVTIAPYQTIVCVVTENSPNFNVANGDYILSIDGLCNAPTVTVKAMPGFDYSSRKPVLYYSAKFNMPIGGFTDSDIVVDTDTGSSVTAFIKDTGLPSNNKDFIIGVTGMQNEGYVDIKIPANAVFSPDEGTANLASINISSWSTHSNSQTTFLNSGISCVKPSSDGVLQNSNEVNIYNTPDSGCGFTKNFFIDNGVFPTKVHLYQNTSGFDMCIGVKIKKNGASSYSFNAYKSNAFLSGNYLTDWIGGSDGAVYSYNGDTYNCSYINVPNGENFYIQVFTANDDYEIILTDINCTNVLANQDFSTPQQITIYPNPSQGVFYVTSKEKLDQISLYNLQGQALKVYVQPESQIDLSGYPNGIYLVEIVSEGRKSWQKISKK